VASLGVWLGLVAENYRQERQERPEERVSLARLLRDLDFDLDDMSGNLERAEWSHRAARRLLDATADPMSVSRDSAEYYLNQFQRRTILAVNDSEYTALFSAGRINVIRDIDLRQRLTELYGWLSEPRLAVDLTALVDYRSSLIDSYSARIADIEGIPRRIRAVLDVDGGQGL